MADTIKINLNTEQRAEIEKLIKKEVYQNLYSEIKKICNYLKDKKFIKTAELINAKEKVYKICLLDNTSALKKFTEISQNAFEEDSKGKCATLTKETQKYINTGYNEVYRKFSTHAAAYKILKVMGVNVCPYCNRQYTFTVHKEKKIRPEFDHFFPKSDYPFLAVSIYNLVPSCGLCNKGKSKSSPEKFLYPYEESFEDKNIRFELCNVIENLLKQEEIVVKLGPVEKHGDLIKQYNDSFKIEALYEQHSDYILELLYKNYIFNDEAIESIYRSYEEFFNSKSELEQLILGKYEPVNFNQRPLSKLTRDILQQLVRK
ncbi:HNH endonuclease domain-containing protein [Tindallia magadiensis]|uniref:HNH endonuclease domain-containing protein n=1 Tax=Tindallia magadiensis TaxID=69895 RepID=UPI000B8443CD|nr:HNH endonuclease domain-containing protein [Tindallia magadiensis]